MPGLFFSFAKFTQLFCGVTDFMRLSRDLSIKTLTPLADSLLHYLHPLIIETGTLVFITLTCH